METPLLWLINSVLGWLLKRSGNDHLKVADFCSYCLHVGAVGTRVNQGETVAERSEVDPDVFSSSSGPLMVDLDHVKGMVWCNLSIKPFV